MLFDLSAADSGAMDANAGDTGLRDAAAVDAAGSDTGPASFAVAITAPYAYGNCFMGPPDPLTVGWTAHVTGPVGDTITLTQASVHVAVPARSYSEDQVMTVDVRSFAIPAGGVIDQDHRKVSGTPSIPICTFCGDTIESALSVTYASSGGGSVTVNTPLTDTGCVF